LLLFFGVSLTVCSEVVVIMVVRHGIGAFRVSWQTAPVARVSSVDDDSRP
jgi:hypothetical protein